MSFYQILIRIEDDDAPTRTFHIIEETLRFMFKDRVTVLPFMPKADMQEEK